MNEFVRETMLKAIYTMAEAALGVIGGATLFSDINIGALISTVLFAGAATVLKCIVMDLPKYTAGYEELIDDEVEDDVE